MGSRRLSLTHQPLVLQETRILHSLILNTEVVLCPLLPVFCLLKALSEMWEKGSLHFTVLLVKVNF